jgi:hypothetical protein
MRLAHHNTRLALCHSCRARSIILILFYVTAIKMEVRYLSFFTSQHAGWKHDTGLALCHSCQARSSLLVSSHFLALHHNHQVVKKDTTLDLRHNCQAGSTMLVSSHCLALCHNHQFGSKILDWLYITAVKMEE